MDDLISRKKLLDDINNLTFSVTLPYPLKASKTIIQTIIQTFFDSIIEIIKKSPSESGWIPCSKRLPKNFVWCLVCMSDGCIRLGKWNSEYDEQGVWWVSHPNSGGKLYRIKNVPFWMPLPELPEQEVGKDAGNS